MMHISLPHRFWTAVIAAAMSISALAAPAPQTPEQLGFQGVTRQDVLAQCKRVGLVPLPRPTIVGADPEASSRIETALTQALQQAGFEVVTPDSYKQAYDRFNQAVGGVYDPMLGTVRKDAYASVYQNAIREYFTKERLGCVATARAVDSKAKIDNNLAKWDGAVEYVDGQANSGLTRVLSGNQGSGFIGAVSIGIQLQNREGKVLFLRYGGVQLASYFDRHHGSEGSDFLVVPRAQLLLDDKRIGRAVTYVAVPLRYTADEILAGSKDPAINTLGIAPASLPLPPAGVQPEEPSPFEVPRAEILSKVHRVVLGSINAGAFNPPAEVLVRYRDLVHHRLEKLGWEVIDSGTLDSAIGAAIRQGGGFHDPLTGAIVPDRLRAEFQSAIKTIALTPSPDAILAIGLVKSLATQKLGNVSWDGTSQNALTLRPAVNRPLLFGGTQDAKAGEGTIAVSSLRVLLRDADGKVLYNASGGIQVLQQLSIKNQFTGGGINHVQQLTDLAPAELFNDSARDELAVAVALRQLVPSSNELTAGESAALAPKRQ
jgi:hypothetical protein